MNSTLLLFFFFFFLSLSGVLLQTEAKQGDALLKFIKAKRSKSHVLGSFFHTSYVNRACPVVHQFGSKEGDKIGKLPGQPANVDFDQYGGYVTVDDKAGRALFYYFAEAAGSTKASKPLLLWLNGGPGCSSLGYGAMEEQGPFRVKSDGKTLYRNPYAWNKVANLLFLESPAGVGYSYSNTTSDYDLSGDERTAEDAYVFLVNWLERFPEYKSRDFYISGESYAGHYVPQLAHTILEHNKLANNTIINLRGINIGNALLNEKTDINGKGGYDYLWTHAIISDETIDGIHKFCDFSPNATSEPKECDQAVQDADNDYENIDPYNIYAPSCFSSGVTDKPKKASILEFDPCTDNYVDYYLNLPEVQKALHANVTKLTHSWSGCSEVITRWGDRPVTMLPLLEEFMAQGLRVWVYSGDVDSVISVTATRYTLNVLGLPVKTSWKPWYIRNEVGGYTVTYKGDLTFATVRGAGHEVPSYQPLRALVLIKSFLLGKPLPSS